MHLDLVPPSASPTSATPPVGPLLRMAPPGHVKRVVRCVHPLNQSVCMQAEQLSTLLHHLQGGVRQVHPHDGTLKNQLWVPQQYNTGSTFSLFSKFALQLLPAHTYSTGNSSKINLLTFPGEEKLFSATKVRLKLNNRELKLSGH